MLCRAANRTVLAYDVMTVTTERESFLRIVALTQFFDNSAWKCSSRRPAWSAFTFLMPVVMWLACSVWCGRWQACSIRISSMSIAVRDVSSHRNIGCMLYVVAEHVHTEIQGVYFALSRSLSSHRDRRSLVVSQNINPSRNTGCIFCVVSEPKVPTSIKVLWLCRRT